MSWRWIFFCLLCCFIFFINCGPTSHNLFWLRQSDWENVSAIWLLSSSWKYFQWRQQDRKLLVIKFQPNHFITEGTEGVLIDKTGPSWSLKTGALHHLPGKLVGHGPGLLFTDDKISPGLLCSLSQAPPPPMFDSLAELQHFVLSLILLNDLVSAPHSAQLCSPCLSPHLGWDASHHALCMSAEGTLPTENLLTVQIDQEKL